MTPGRVLEADATSGAMPGGEALDLAAYSRAARKFIGGEYRKLNAFVMAELRLNPRGRILEIGPGPGWIGIWLAKQLPGSEIVGFELSPDMIRIAEQNRADEGVENVRFVQGDAADLSRFEAASFDAVVSNGSLHHWLDPVVVFDEVARVLKLWVLYGNQGQAYTSPCTQLSPPWRWADRSRLQLRPIAEVGYADLLQGGHPASCCRGPGSAGHST